MTDWVQATVRRNRQWTPQLFSLQFDAPIAPFKAGQFLRVAMDIDQERVGRPYSFVNAPHETPLEIYFNIIPEGPLSGRLATLQPGDTLWANRTANGFLTLDEIPDVPHLWLLATGTALGPFLSILKTDEPWRRFKRIVLAHGVRHANELSYQDTIQNLLDAHGGQLHYAPFVSREQVSGVSHGRITQRLVDRSLEHQIGLPLQAEDSHVMLCGNAAMIEDVSKLLAERGMRRHRRREPGQITTEKYH